MDLRRSTRLCGRTPSSDAIDSPFEDTFDNDVPVPIAPQTTDMTDTPVSQTAMAKIVDPPTDGSTYAERGR
jgi:hypothetical protein